MKNTLFLLFSAALLTGCAVNPQVRGLAAQIGSFAGATKASTDDFKTRYDRYNGQLQARITAQNAGTVDIGLITARQTQSWSLTKNTRAADAYKQLTVTTGDTIVSEMMPPPAAPAALDAGNFDAQMTAGIKAAASLAQKPSTFDNVKAFAGTLQTIDATLNTLQSDAAKAAPAVTKGTPAPAAP